MAPSRSGSPPASGPAYFGFDVVTRYDDARDVAARPKTFSSADGSFIVPSGFPPIPPLHFDDPDHRRWVKLMQPPLTLAAVRDLEPTITEIVNDHIDRFAAAGSAELFADLAEPVPVNVIARLVGLDAEAAVEMRRVAMNVFAAIGTDEFAHHMQAFTDFTDAELAARREHPRGDYLSDLASGIEESLRLTTPLQYFTRTATEDTEISGCPVPSGRRVVLNFGAAHRDPREFPEPDTFDPDRDRNKQLHRRRVNARGSFGSGAPWRTASSAARQRAAMASVRCVASTPPRPAWPGPVQHGKAR